MLLGECDIVDESDEIVLFLDELEVDEESDMPAVCTAECSDEADADFVINFSMFSLFRLVESSVCALHDLVEACAA